MLLRVFGVLCALLSTGCVVTSGHLTRGQHHDAVRQWGSGTVRALPPDSPRIAEVVLAINGQTVQRRHLAARPDQDDWATRLTSTLPALNRETVPLESPAAFLVHGLPLEVARWLAVAEYHWQIGGRHHTVKHRSVEREYAESSIRGVQNQAIRQVLRFRLGKDIVCASQRKVYGETLDRPIAPASDLVTAYRRSQGLDSDSPFGISPPSLVGQVVMQVFELDHEQIRIEVHHGLARTTTPNGESVDTILVCSMPRSTQLSSFGQFRFLETPLGPAALFQPSRSIAWAE